MNVSVKKITVKEAFSNPNWERLIEDYTKESKNSLMPPIDAKEETYQELENSGMFKAVGAFDDDKLIGFVSFNFTVAPHFNVRTCYIESIFVMKEYRNTSAAKNMMNLLTNLCKQLGVKAIFLSTPINGRLEKAARIFGFTPKSTLHTKVIK